MADELLCEDRGAVRILTMNRPAKLNALNFALTRALLDALGSADRDDGVRCVVLAGAGRAFCAGADLAEFAELTPEHGDRVAERARLTTALHALFPQLGKPVVGAVNGWAAGGGAGLAIACDLVVAAEGARFAYPELKHGIVPAIVMANLVRVVGRKQAFELIATGRTVSASEALALGMVNRVVPEPELLPAALALAETVAAFSPPAMRLAKALFYQVGDLPFGAALEEARHVNERMRGLPAQRAPEATPGAPPGAPP